MRNNRWGLILLALSLTLSLVGCSPKAPEETGDGTVISSYSSDDYQTLLPHELSEGRYWRGNTNSRFDLMQMPKELIELSKQHFSVKDNYLQAGQILEYEDIQELQRYESSDHSYGLNPSGNFEISDAIILERPYIVYGIVEIDFISKEDQKTLNGISVGILMNSSVTSGDSTVQIPQDKLYTYASTIGRKLNATSATKPKSMPICRSTSRFTARIQRAPASRAHSSARGCSPAAAASSRRLRNNGC